MSTAPKDKKEINDIVKDLDNENRQKIIQEINLLKTQRLIAILTAVGAVFAFLTVTHQ